MRQPPAESIGRMRADAPADRSRRGRSGIVQRGVRARARQIDVGAVLAAAGAVVLLVSLFLHWYRPGVSAWTVFETLDLVLAVLALAALGCVLAELGLGAWASPRWLPALGAVALVIVCAALVNHPPAAIGHRPDVGICLALGG